MAKTLLGTLAELLEDPEHESPPVARFCVSFVFGALMILQLLKLKVSLAINRKQRSKTSCYVASRLRSHSHEVFRHVQQSQDEAGRLQHVSGRPSLSLPPLPYSRTTVDSALAGTLKEAAKGYSPLLQDIQALYFTGVYTKFKDCFHREATSCPSALITVRDDDGTEKRCINLASYNYLGFSVSDYHSTLMEAIDRYGSCNPFPRSQCVPALTVELEEKLAKFLLVDDCIVHSMGFDTNAVLISSVVKWVLKQAKEANGRTENSVDHNSGHISTDSRNSLPADKVLVISDSLNHASIVSGISEAEADLVIWQHHNFEQLQQYLEQYAKKVGSGRAEEGKASARDELRKEPGGSGLGGQDNEFGHYAGVLLIVEGIYSMEGEILDLPQILALKRRYSFCLYVDEAHSIGAIGPEGGGVADYYGYRSRWKECPPRIRNGWESEGIDVYMGTFSKSFAAAGGYVAGTRSLISFIRDNCPGYAAVPAMNSLCTKQILDCLESGRLAIKAKALRENSIYFRKELAKMGVRTYGNTPDSPVVPVLLYNIVKMQFVSAEMRRRGIAVVVVGFPAVPMQFSRIRFCLSAGHTREMLDYALDHFAQIVRLLCLDYEFFRGRGVVYSYFKQMFELRGRRPVRSQSLVGSSGSGGSSNTAAASEEKTGEESVIAKVPEADTPAEKNTMTGAIAPQTTLSTAGMTGSPNASEHLLKTKAPPTDACAEGLEGGSLPVPTHFDVHERREASAEADVDTGVQGHHHA